MNCRSDGDSDDSAYLGDCDNDDIQPAQKSIVELSHKVLTDFLKGQLMNVGSEIPTQQTGKKRNYNNAKRAAAAERAKRMKHPCGDLKRAQRLARNDPEPWWKNGNIVHDLRGWVLRLWIMK